MLVKVDSPWHFVIVVMPATIMVHVAALVLLSGSGYGYVTECVQVVSVPDVLMCIPVLLPSLPVAFPEPVAVESWNPDVLPTFVDWPPLGREIVVEFCVE